MYQLQKKFFWGTFSVFLLAIGCALLIRTGGDLFLQPAFSHLFARYDLPGAILLIFILIAGFFFSHKIPETWVDSCLDYIANNPLKISLFLFFIVALGAYFVYHQHPLCMDEYMPYFQSRIFAEGKLWGQYPPELVPWLLRPGFFSVFSTETGRVVSDYWPGFALLLTPFMKLGVPWLLNPIISAGTFLLLFYYSKTVFQNNTAASWVVLLTLSSSVFLVNGISFYSMNAHLLLNLVYATLLLKLSPSRLFLAGVFGSFALVLHNPLPHIAFSLPWIIWIALNQNKFRNLSILFLGYLPLSLFLGIGWFSLKLWIVNGGVEPIINSGINVAQSVPIQSISPQNNNFLSMFLSRVFILAKNVFKLPGLELLWSRLLGLLKLFAWSLPGLPLLAIFSIKYIRESSHLKLWGWSALVTLFAYLFVPVSQGHGWGFRYFHSSWFVMPLLSTALITSTILEQISWKKIVFSLAILSLVFSTTLRVVQVHQFIHQHLSQLPAFEEKCVSVCMVNTPNGYYLSDLVQNDPFLRDPVTYMLQSNPKKDKEMIETFFPGAKKVSDTSNATTWQLSEDFTTIWDSDALTRIKQPLHNNGQ